MINLKANIENIEQLRAEKARLIALADDKEKEINLQLKELNDRLRPIKKILGLMKDGQGSGHMMRSAFMSGLKSTLPFLFSSLISGKKGGLYGAATAVGGDMLLKSMKDFDFSKITDFIGNIFKKKPKANYEPIDWEHEIYT